jgi:sulfide:quinone oxidoreductase
MAKILILGGGFAAVSAAETLARAAKEHEVTLVSKNSDLTFYPAIVPMIFGDFTPDDIHFDLRPRLAARNIAFVQGEVRSINTQRRAVSVARDRIDEVLHYDYLIVAIGPRVGSIGIPGLLEFSHNLTTIDGALRFKGAIAEFDAGPIVLGLCPMAVLPVPVCESALALARKFARQIDNKDVSVTVIFPTSVEKAFSGSALFRDIEGEFRLKGINLITDFEVSHVDETHVFSTNGASVPHKLLALMPAYRSQLSLRNLGPVTDISGFLRVDDYMQVEGADRVYAAGDIVSFSGPKFGYMAIRQGKVAATNILADLFGDDHRVKYEHKIPWALKSKYTGPIFFHYGVWDDTLTDFDPDALFGIAKEMRDRYGSILKSDDNASAAA